MANNLDELAVQVGRDAVGYRDGNMDYAAILGARAMLAKLRELGLVKDVAQDDHWCEFYPGVDHDALG